MAYNLTRMSNTTMTFDDDTDADSLYFGLWFNPLVRERVHIFGHCTLVPKSDFYRYILRPANVKALQPKGKWV